MATRAKGAKVRKRRRRPLKRHVQQELLDAAGTKARSTRGGKRRGAGRPPKGARAGSPHKARPALEAKHPVHVTLRAVPIVRTLRGFDIYHAIRKATAVAAARREGFRIVHLSIQADHVHLIVEAEDRMALSRGMQGFQISAAKWINRAVSKDLPTRRRGQVFADRYHAEIITSPRQARRALAYVLNNWRKHRADRGAQARTWQVDPFSTAGLFTGWKELADAGVAAWTLRADYQPLTVWPPRTWVLRDGWRRHGLLRCHEVPGARAAPPP
jgi:REP element-mobilizing transposase RayT